MHIHIHFHILHLALATAGKVYGYGCVYVYKCKFLHLSGSIYDVHIRFDAHLSSGRCQLFGCRFSLANGSISRCLSLSYYYMPCIHTSLTLNTIHASYMYTYHFLHSFIYVDHVHIIPYTCHTHTSHFSLV